MPEVIAAERPKNEPERLAALHRYRILDTPAEQSFDDLALLASHICGTPMSLVSFVDSGRQWFKARVNFEASETPREVAFCAHAILGNDLFIVPDAAADRRFAGNPMVTGGAGIRFYAGAPLVTSDGHSIGTLCVMDRKPRTLTPSQAEALRALSRQVVVQLELRRRVTLEREEADEVIHEKEETLRVLVSQMPAVLWTTDRDLRLTVSTGAGLRFVETPNEGIRGMSLFAYFKTADPEFPAIAAHRRALQGEPATYEQVWQGRTFQAHVEPLREPDGTIHGVVGVAFDITGRTQEQEELQRSIALLNATIDSTADGILVVDANGKMVNFNHRFVVLWGIPDAIAVSRDESQALAFVLDKLDDPPAFIKRVMTVSAQPSAVSHDVVALKDGRLIERDSLPQVVDGRTVGRVWSFRDVTERKRVEEEVENTLSLLKATLEATADGILVVDQDGKIVSFNRKFVEMWKLPDSVIASRDDSQAIAFVLDQLRDPERFVKKLKELYDQPDAQSYDWLEFKDGRFFERYSHPQKIAGKTVGRVWSFHDVTRLRLMEDTLRRQARAFEHISDGVMLMNLEGQVLDWNAGAEKMFGYSKEEMLGKSPSVLAGSEGDGTRVMLDAMRKVGRWTGEVSFVRKDGSPGICDTVVVPLGDEFGRTLAALGVSRDVTERKNLEAQLKKERETKP